MASVHTLVENKNSKAQDEESTKAGKDKQEVVEYLLSHLRLAKYSEGEDITKKTDCSNNGIEFVTDPKNVFQLLTLPIHTETIIKNYFFAFSLHKAVDSLKILKLLWLF